MKTEFGIVLTSFTYISILNRYRQLLDIYSIIVQWVAKTNFFLHSRLRRVKQDDFKEI